VLDPGSESEAPAYDAVGEVFLGDRGVDLDDVQLETRCSASLLRGLGSYACARGAGHDRAGIWATPGACHLGTGCLNDSIRS
jgi:hypothetical protein